MYIYIYHTSQLTQDVVTTLGFGCILVATSDNVVTTLSQRCVSDLVTTTKTNVLTMSCFRRRFSVLALTLRQHRDSDVAFLTNI